LTRNFLNDAGTSLLFPQFAAGYDNIDIAEATRLNIPVGNTPRRMSDATADVAFGLMHATSRRMFYMHNTHCQRGVDHFRLRQTWGLN
jgi:glyoxylate reductase